MAAVQEGALLWEPSAEYQRSTEIFRYMTWLADNKGLRFSEYADLWQWSVEHLEDFWGSIWEFFAVQSSSPYRQVLAARKMPGAKWFEGAQLNLAQHAFRNADTARPAIISQSESRALTEMSWGDLRGDVAALATALRAMGVGKGDRVVAYLPNIAETVVAFLACASIGAIWSSCSPDMGSASVLDRFRQIEPKVLIAVDGYRYGGKDFDRSAVLQQLMAELPTVEHMVLLPYLDPESSRRFPGAVLWSDLLHTPAELTFTPVDFDHPLWVVYSSGTSGMPKPIVHGHGGVLLEMLKGHALHLDLTPQDRFFWLTTTGWIMWNSQIGGLLVGATILLFDGNPGWPDLQTLWRFAGESRATFFGAGAAFLTSCMKFAIEPAACADLTALKGIGSTGSPLPVPVFDWVYRHVKSDVLLASISGGTDPCAAFVGACPLLPVHAGEMQCRCLGAAVYAYDDAGKPVIDQVGELVCTEPMPSMPLYFWNDRGNKRYHESYFELFPGKWRHGDWLKITPRGSAIIYGRSDATINRFGIRMGTSEIYRAIEGIAEIVDSLIVDLEYLGRPSYMPLFVVLRAGAALDETLIERIETKIRTDLSARYVPNDVFTIAEVPRTLSGKKMEVPVKKLLLGMALENVASRDAMGNPHSLDFFVAFAARLAAARNDRAG